MSDAHSGPGGMPHGYDVYDQGGGRDRRSSQYSPPYNPTPPQRAPTMPIPNSGGFFAPYQRHDSTSPYHTPPPPHSQPWPTQTHEWPPSSPFESPPPNTPYAPGSLVSIPEGAPAGYHSAHFTPYQPGYDTDTRHPHALARAETMPSSTHQPFSSSPPTASGFGSSGLVSTEPQSYVPSASTVHRSDYTPQTYEQPPGTPTYLSQSEYPHSQASATVPHRSATFAGAVWAVENLLGHTDTGERRAQPTKYYSGKHRVEKPKPDKQNRLSDAQPSQQYHQYQPQQQQQPPLPYQYPPQPAHHAMPPAQR